MAGWESQTDFDNAPVGDGSTVAVVTELYRVVGGVAVVKVDNGRTSTKNWASRRSGGLGGQGVEDAR